MKRILENISYRISGLARYITTRVKAGIYRRFAGIVRISLGDYEVLMEYRDPDFEGRMDALDLTFNNLSGRRTAFLQAVFFLLFRPDTRISVRRKISEGGWVLLREFRPEGLVEEQRKYDSGYVSSIQVTVPDWTPAPADKGPSRRTAPKATPEAVPEEGPAPEPRRSMFDLDAAKAAIEAKQEVDDEIAAFLEDETY